MSGNDELLKAMMMFKESTKEWNVQQALGQANERVRQIKASAANEAEQRKQLYDVSNQLVGFMAGQGVNPATLAQVGQAIGPRQFASPAQAAMEGALSGDKGLMQAAADADMAAQAGNIAQAKQQQAFQASENDKSRQLQWNIANMKGEAKAPTADQSKAAGFASRVYEANSVFDKLVQDGYDRASIGSSIDSVLPNRLKNKQTQMQQQAERDFINAVLRRESGAAISPSEFDSAELQYFPRSGDSPEVIEQKRRNRLTVMESLAAEGEPALKRMNKTITGIKVRGSDGGEGAPDWTQFIRK